MNKKTAGRAAAVAAVAVLSLTLAACGKKDNAAAAPSKPTVGVVTLKAQPVSLTTELPGRTSAFRIAEVRPQVNGIVLKRLFTEGGRVKAGQQLYQIDPSLYQATLDSQRAALARAEAQVKSATLLAERYKPLTETRAISRQTYDDAVAARDQAKADVLSAKAAVETARINLVYTKVLSPIDGIIGRSMVTEGALVTANQADALASVQQIDPIYVDVVQSSVQLLRLQDQLAKGEIKRAEGEQAAQVTLTLEDGTQYNHQGKLQFSEVTVDQSTGSVTLRAVFPNPEHRLLPGMFVRAKLVDGVAAEGLLVPQRGVTRSQRGTPIAYVVDAQGKIAVRDIVTDRAIGSDWLVTSGLKPGDKVVVEGLQTIRPGMEVAANEVNTQPAAAAAAPAAPAQ
ncbi:efflux RND transporter periplasmic adaptor subunit [Bordetella genomosp. 9]|uniref:Efflux transporter periplasmic adaptor subunit n=1 Tax=Bordetella genomosp. 9 TaxID=1416803 RepID=A0A1W6YZV3_9BORD|nr:efflux RND transporter periplasmic adaptor subunit [Bordetella genomosp. 9]ARP86474.1 efflux transporter periplasmic adaptor subunit [Bordetella genomosp. 9]ARP90489.1 efflux transporter periplasmic adaptor subunit [Bordetella genomosp. 9]